MTSLGRSQHDRAVLILSRRLAETGFDVVRPTAGTSPDSLLNAVIAEDVDALGLSICDAAGFADLSVLIGLLDRCDTRSRLVFVGGRLEPDQIAEVTSEARAHFFARDSTTREIVAWLELNVTARTSETKP